MIYTTCFMFYATFTHFRSGRFHPVLALSLVGLAAFITLYYHYLQNPVFHQNAYAILTATILLRSMWIMEKRLRPLARHDGLTENDATRVAFILSTMWTMIAYGLSAFLGGFAIWGLDNRYCASLIQWRRTVGLPWGVVLEGHGWWYVAAAFLSK